MPIAVTKMSLVLRGFFITWILASLGEAALSAGALCFSLFFVVAVLLVGLSQTGVGVLASQAIGNQQYSFATEIFQQGFITSLQLALPAMLILYFAPNLFQIFIKDHTVLVMIKILCHLLTSVMIPFSIIISGYKFFDCTLRPNISVRYSFLGVTFCCFLCYVFSKGLWGFPNEGIKGIGIALIIAYWIQMIVMIIHIFFTTQQKKYPLREKFFSFNRDISQNIWKIGIPIALRNCSEYFAFFIIASILASYAHYQLPVFQVILQYLFLTSELAYSIWVGIIIISAKAIVTTDYKSLIEIAWTGFIFIVLVISCTSIIIWYKQDTLITIFFNKTTYSYHLLKSLVFSILFIQFLDGLRKISASFLVAIKDQVFLLLTEVFSLFILAIPCGFYFNHLLHNTIFSFLLGLMVGFLINNILLLLRMKLLIKQNKKESEMKIDSEQQLQPYTN